MLSFSVIKGKKLAIIAIIVATLLPTVAVASVIIEQTWNVTTKTPSNPIVFTWGPNYKTAQGLGFVTLTNGSTTSSTPSANSITVGYVGNDTRVELVNVFEIVDHNTNDTASVELNASSSSVITVYYNTSQVTETFPTIKELGTPLTSTPSSPISISSTTPIYISIVVSGTVSSSSPVTITMSYSLS